MVRTLLISLICLWAWVAPAQADPLRVGTEGQFKPFNYFDEKGDLAGFDIEITRALCAVMKADCQLVAMSWEELLPALEAGHIDMIVASMSKTEERLKHADFTDRYYRSRSVFIARRDAPITVTREGVTGKRLVTQKATVFEDWLIREFGSVAKIKGLPTAEDAFAEMMSGKADLMLIDNLVAFEVLSAPKGELLEVVGAVPESDAEMANTYIQVHKGNDALRQAINDALRKIWLEGTYRKINEKYFPFDIY